MILIWQCGECADIKASSNLQRHRMDECKCGSSFVDLEEGYSRMGGYPIRLKIIEGGILLGMHRSMVEQDVDISWHELLEEERESYERIYQ